MSAQFRSETMAQGVNVANKQFKKYLEATQSYYKSVHGKNLPENMQSALGHSLQNMQRYFEGVAKKRGYLRTEGLTTSDLGTYIRHGFELVSAIIPSSILDDLVSVQPMDRKTGQVFWLDYMYDTNKGAIRQGDVMFNAQSPTANVGGVGAAATADGGFASTPTGYGNTSGAANRGNAYSHYSDEYVRNEPVVNGATGIDHYPIVIGSNGLGVASVVTIRETSPAGVVTTYTRPVAAAGTLDLSVGNAGGLTAFTIDVETGQATVNAVVTALWTVDISYQFSFDARPENTARVKLRIREGVVVAEKRQLAMNWLLDSAFELEQHYGKSIDDEAIALLAGFIRAEIDQLVLDDIYNNATPSVLSGAARFNAANPFFISELERIQDFVKHLQRESSQIHAQTRRIQGTWLVCGRYVADMISSMPSTMFQIENNGTNPPTGPHKIGKLMGRWDVYKNLAYGDSEYVMGAKGDSWLNAGYAWLPFIPVMVTDPYPIGNLEYERGVITKNAQAMLNEGFFVKSSVLGL